jgi:hypothetical protein
MTMIDVIRELSEIRAELCGDCAKKVAALLARWNAQVEEAESSLETSFMQQYRWYFTDHEWRQQLWGQKELTPAQKAGWRKWVKDLYEEVRLEEQAEEVGR